MEIVDMIGASAMILLHSYGGGGILSGFLHPLLGLDHLLAMLAVGILSAQIGGRALWTVPATFVGTMAIGALLGIAGFGLPIVEYGITFSVLILGIAILFGNSIPEWAALIAVAIFALFHGNAHGTEIPEITNTFGLLVAYILGFLIATAGLHVVGALIGILAGRLKRGQMLMRLGGLVIAAIGILLILNI
ncbi:MAG: HupE/UreJ family protein [Candidatus Promineifilaceae bacterium]|nr:HupE/UreJ family protein [Candidatus Promineifilaceae bacterium]